AEVDSCPCLRPDPRRPATARQDAEPQSPCGPATTPAPSFAILRADFSLGEGLAYKSDVLRLLRHTVSQVRDAGKLPEVHRGSESSCAARGLTGRCPVTIKLMPYVVGMVFKNGESTVQLLDQNHTSQFVGERHLSQGQDKTGVAARFFAKTIAATDSKQQRNRVHLLAFEKLGEFLRGKLFASRIEENELVALLSAG